MNINELFSTPHEEVLKKFKQQFRKSRGSARHRLGKKTFVKKSSKVSETLQQSKLSMNKKKPSIIKDLITLILSGTSINVNLGHSAWIYLTQINLACKFS